MSAGDDGTKEGESARPSDAARAFDEPMAQGVTLFDADGTCTHSGGPYGAPLGLPFDVWCGTLREGDADRLRAMFATALVDGHASARLRISKQGARAFVTLTRVTHGEGESALCLVAHTTHGDLAGRDRFLDTLQDILDRGESDYAVVVVDIPEFRRVVSGLGHRGSSALLGSIGERMRRVLGAQAEVFLVGASEFAVLLRSISDDDIGRGWMSVLHEEMRKPFSVMGQEIVVRTAAGLVGGQRGYEDAAVALSDAEAASLRAVFRDTSGSEVFKTAIRNEDKRLIEVAGALRGAAARDELRVAYQPIVQLSDMRVVGFEALLRWNHPQLGEVSPAEFIPIAEKLGWVRELDEWIMQAASEELVAWDAAAGSAATGSQLADVSLSVNVSARWADDPVLIECAERVLRQTGLAPERLRVEITETALVRNPEAYARVLMGLRNLGVKLAMDDFGTGYSSLRQLADMPLDVLKIDRSFIMRMEDAPRERDIIRAVVAMGHLLGMTIVAEGIETEAQRDWLREMGCDHGQGYWIDRPLSPKDAHARLR